MGLAESTVQLDPGFQAGITVLIFFLCALPCIALGFFLSEQMEERDATPTPLS